MKETDEQLKKGNLMFLIFVLKIDFFIYSFVFFIYNHCGLYDLKDATRF